MSAARHMAEDAAARLLTLIVLLGGGPMTPTERDLEYLCSIERPLPVVIWCRDRGYLTRAQASSGRRVGTLSITPAGRAFLKEHLERRGVPEPSALRSRDVAAMRRMAGCAVSRDRIAAAYGIPEQVVSWLVDGD